MVALVTGNGVGLGNSSANVLGQGGQLGPGQLGVAQLPGAAGNAYVNASNGNLIIQRQDELLIGRGPDIGVYQTYNSQGTFDFDNNDNWQVSLYRQLSGLTGTVNTAGSTITRTAADGTALVYTYDSTAGSATLGKYVNKDGSGSFDTLTFTSASNTWVWQDGNSRIKESYAVDPNDSTKWRITSVTDLDNNSLTYAYNANSGLIDSVTNASNNEVTQLIYNLSKQLTQVNVTNSNGVTTTRIRYTYESTALSARLLSVSTDLTPVDGSIADGKTYTTTYTYDSASKRIASITNSDGSKVSFTYEQSGLFRLLTISDYVVNSSTVSNITTINYSIASTTTITTIDNASNSLTTTLTYDATTKQLTNIQGPLNSGQNVSYNYNASGDVIEVKDGRNNWTKYTYDVQGNQLSSQDNLGNTVTRTYGSNNELLTQTVYTTPDANVSDTTLAASGAQTTRYTYDSNNHVRFTISAEGRVTEYRYNANGQLTSTHQYTDHLNTSTGNQTEALMNNWLTAAVKSKSQRTDYLYDARGQLSETIVYTKVNATAGSEGNGIADGTQLRTQYVYDQSGNLLQKIDARGVASSTTNDYMTSYSYDGLNRLTLTKQYDATGLEANAVSTQVTYTDASRQVKLTLANGLVTTSTYDLAGRLISVQKSDSVNTTAGSLGTTSYVYDKLGNLRMVTDAAGQNTYYLYDNANRKVGEIDENKNLTEWVYNANSQVIRNIQYNKPVTATLDADTALSNTLTTTGISNKDAANDRVTHKLYDAAGRLAKEIDALGYVTEYQYDGASRLLKTIAYANALNATQLNAVNAATSELLPTNSNTVPVADSTNDRASRNLYDNDGKLAGSLDAEGYLTEYVYDKAGRQIQKIRYATVTASAYWASGTLATLRTNATAVSADTPKHQTTNYIYDAAGQLTGMVDAENYLTQYFYDLAGNQLAMMRYANKMVGTLVTNTMPQVLSSAGTGNYVVMSPEDQYLMREFDANNRLAATADSTGLFTRNTYDNVGNLTQILKYYSGATTAQQRLQRSQYDSRGNLVAQLSGEGAVALLGLGANPTQALKDAIWNTYGTQYNYDNAGRLINKTEPNGLDSAGNKTLYYYDNEGKLTYTINALGEVSQTVYNSFDQVAETRRYNTWIASATLTGLAGGADSAVASAIAGINAGGYSNILFGYDKRGQLISTTDELTNVNSRTYNAFGELKERTDRVDNSTTALTNYQYDRRGLLKTTTEEIETGITRATQAIYDAFGRLTQTTDGRNNTRQYQYDRLGREVTTTDGLSENTVTTYDAFSRVLTRKDGRNNTVTYSYNAVTRAMTMTTSEGVVIETVKNQYGEVVSIKDGRGGLTSYQYNTDGKLVVKTTPDGVVTTKEYDTASRILVEADGNLTETIYTYDAVGRVIRRRVTDQNDDYDASYRYRYDAQGRQVWEQNPNGVWTRMDYDAKGQLTSITVDPKRTANWVSGADDNTAGLELKTSYTYDARGKKLTVVEGDGSTNPRTTQYTYDKLGRLKSTIIDPGAAGSGKLNLTTTYTYDKNDNLVLKTDAAGYKTVYTYDANNRLIYTVDALGYVSKIDYDANGNVLTTTNYSTALAATTLTTLQTTVVSSAQSNAAVTISPTSTATDRITRQVFDKDNRLSFMIDANNYVTKFEYDANGNVVKTTEYATALTAAPVAGVAPSVTNDPTKDRVTQTVYDALNRATLTVDAKNYVTAYSYDVNGNVIKKVRYATAMAGTLTTNTAPQILGSVGTGNYVVTNAADQTTRYYYDAVNRQKAVINAEGYITTYIYDALYLTITTRHDDKATNVSDYSWSNTYAGRQDAYMHDAAGRLTNYATAIETSATQLISYTYDAIGNQIEISEAGAFNPATRTTQQKFDAAGRKIEVIDGEGKSTKTEYNAIGSIVKVTDALGNIGYFYNDALGRVKVQVDPEGSVTQTDYDAWGNTTQVLRYSGKVQTSGTGVLNTSANIQFATSAPANSVYVLINKDKDQKQTTEYDKQGQKLNVKTWTGATDSTTAYYTESFTYDAFGNALTVKARNNATTTYTYDKLGNKQTEVLPVTARNAANTANIDVKNTFTYDAFGNLATKVEADGALTSRTTTYAYDKLNQQTQTSQSVQTSTGVSASAVTQKTYDARGNLVAEKDANGNWTYHFYDKLDRRAGTVKADGSYTAWGYDALGNVTNETRYANGIQLRGTATLVSATWVNPVSVAPTSGNSVYVITDATNDRTIYYTYDKVGRQTSNEIRNVTTTGVFNAGTQQYPLVTGNITNLTEYDGLGNIIKQTDANGNVTRSWYNKAGQSVAKLDAEGYLTVWDRDVYGNISKETRYATKPANAVTNPLTVNNSTTLAQLLNTANTLGNIDDRITNIVYDKLNRVSTETVVNVLYGQVNTTTGNLSDANGVSATTGSVSVRKDVTTSYQYDGLNNVTQKTDAALGITNWTYDNLGRQTLQSDPAFVDSTTATVRVRNGKEYDGLNNVTRELRRGKDDAANAANLSAQVETDDQITLYTYGAGGRLISETDAMGAVIEYEYDLNGNLLKKTLKNRKTADQIISNTTGVDDIATYTYDALNRQITNSTKSTSETVYTFNEVRYNNFSEVINKRTYTNTTGIVGSTNGWDEFAEFDRAGRVFKNNIKDGVTKVYIYDKNGNATIQVTSSDAANTINLTQNKETGSNSLADLFNAANTLRTMSLYDKRNQLLTTIQAAMNINHQVNNINTSTSTNNLTNSTNPLTTNVNSAQLVNPINHGSIGIGRGEVSYSTSTSTSYPNTVNVNFNLPKAEIIDLGSGSITIEVTATVNVVTGLGTSGGYLNVPYTYYPIYSSTVVTKNIVVASDQISGGTSFDVGQPRSFYTGGGIGFITTYYGALTNISYKVSKATDRGNIRLLSSTNSASAALPKQVYVSSQPPSTNRVLLSYRPAGSQGVMKTVLMNQVMNTNNEPVTGYFSFDWSGLTAGEYEFNYSSVDANGNVLNQQSGIFSTALAQTPATVTFNTTPALSLNPSPAVIQDGSSLIKVGGSSGAWDADATSQNSFTGSAYVSARAGQINKGGMIGLNSDPLTDKSHTSLDYAWFTKADGTLEIYESNTNVTNPATGTKSFGSYNTFDILAIEYNGTTVKYLKNGTVVRTVTTTVGRSFSMDSSFYNTDFAFHEVKFGANADTANGVVLRNDNALVKTGGTNAVWGDAEATSQTGFIGGAYVEARAGQTNLGGMIGLNSDPLTDKHYSSLDYAWFTKADGTLEIYESNANVTNPATGTKSFGSYNPADILAIEYSGTTVKYLKNGVVIKTSTTTANRMFYMDSSFYQKGFTFNDVKFGADAATAKLPLFNNDNAFVATAANSTWTGSSTYSFNSQSNGAYVAARAGQTNLGGMFGLNSDPLTDKNYTSLDYAWFTKADGTLEIYESNNNITNPATGTKSFGAYNSGDILAIEYVGNTVNYLKNGVAVRSVTTDVGRTFYMDSSFYNSGFTLRDLRFGATAATATAMTELTAAVTTTPVTTQNGIAIGGVGRAFISDSGSSGLSVNGLQLVNQGDTADNITLRYRVKGSTGSWSTIVPGSFVKSAANAGYGLGHFSLSTSNMSMFANNTTYEVEIEVRDSSNNLLRISSTEIKRDAAGVLASDVSLSLKKLRLSGQPINAAYVDVAYRAVGSNGTYSTPVRIYPTSTNSGLFDWDITGLPAGNQDISIKSYNSSNALLNNYQAYITFGDNSAVVNAISSLNNPRYITINPPNANAVDYVVVGYRLKGSNATYTPLPMSTPYVNGSTKEFRVTIPLLEGGVYEYIYTAYKTDIANYVDPASITITPPSGTPAGASNVQVKYAVKVAVPNNPPEGYIPPAPTWVNVTTTQITAANGDIQYKLNLPANIAEDEYVFEYKTYTLVTDPLDPNYNTYQWAAPISKEFSSTIKTTPLESNLGEFTVQANANISNTQSGWTWTSPTSSLATIARQQTYNAFGQIATETDGRGNVTNLSYNTLGYLTKRVDPTVSITTETGEVQTVPPTTEYTYDAIGRMIAMKDANGNVNTQVLLASGDDVALEKHADGGIRTVKYDVFGNKVSETDEVNRTTLYEYDKENRLTQVTHPSGVIDRYTYDAAGQRVSHTRNHATVVGQAGDTEKTYYDSLGRVIQTKTYMGFATNYSYTYTNNVTGIAGAIVNGWVKTTTDAVGRNIVDTTDMFDRTFKHQDLGNHVFTYTYNRAGWLTKQTGTTGQNIAYDHYANGYIKSIHDKALGMYTFYEYDADGNKSFEGYVSLKDPANLNGGYQDYFQQATISYDALNRITRVEDPRALITYTYDAVGNRRSVRSEYKDGVSGAQQVQEYWYKYDKVNRFLITMGTFNTGLISKGTTGVDISYNLAGERVQAINGVDNTRENYTYSADGYLTDVKVNNVLRSRRTNDLLGRTTTMTEYKENGSTSYSLVTTYDKDNRTLTQKDNSGNKTWFNYYSNARDSASAYDGAGELARTWSDSDGDGNANSGTIIDTTYAYEYWDDAKVTAITADPYNRAIKKNNRIWANGYSDVRYDVNGHISAAVDYQGNRNIRYVSDAQGVVLLRDEITGTIARPNYRYYANTYNPGTVANKVERFYYVDGKAVGGVGNDGPSRVDYVQSMANRGKAKGNYAGWKPVASADFDQNYEPISPTNPGPVSGSYTVKSGDTLQSIARTVWGDAAMWYLIADANGLSPAQTISANVTLIIPNKVTNIHNNAGTFRPYNPGEAIGDINPTIPAMPKPPKKKSCGGFAMIIVAVVAIAATVMTAGAAAAAMAPAGATIGAGATATAVGSAGAWAAGTAALSGSIAGMSTGAMFAAAAIGGAVGSIAGQVAGNALGVQNGFSWAGVATSALTAGLGANGVFPTVGADATWGQIAANAAMRNTVSQGLGIVTGQQKGFSWSSVVGSAIAAPITNSLTKNLGPVGGSIGVDLTRATTGALVSATTRLVVQRGKISWAAVAADTLSDFIYSRASSSSVQGNSVSRKQLDEQFIAAGISSETTGSYFGNISRQNGWNDAAFAENMPDAFDANLQKAKLAVNSEPGANATASLYDQYDLSDSTNWSTYLNSVNQQRVSGLTLNSQDVETSKAMLFYYYGYSMGEQRGTAEQLKGSLDNQQSPALSKALQAFSQSELDEQQQRYDLYSNIKTVFDANGNATRGKYVDVVRDGRTVTVKWTTDFSDWGGHIGVSANEALRKTDFDVYKSAINAAFRTDQVNSFSINGAWRPAFSDYKAAYEIMKSQDTTSANVKAMEKVINKYGSNPWKMGHVTSRAIDMNKVNDVSIRNTSYTKQGPKLSEPVIVRQFTNNLVGELNSKQLFQPWRMWNDTRHPMSDLTNYGVSSNEVRHNNHLHFGLR